MSRKLMWCALALCSVLSAPKASAGESGETFKKGYRGVTLPAPKHQLVNLRVGDRVDVLVTFDAKLKDGKEKVTATILQNVAVLNVSKQEETIELALNPNEAQYAVLGVQQGDTLWYIVRAEGDNEMKPMEMASFRKLFR